MYYLISFLIFLIVVNITALLPEPVFKLLLAPHAVFASLFYNARLYYRAGEGYVSAAGDYIIGFDCLGTGFIAAIFLLLSLTYLKNFKSWHRGLWLVVCFVISIIIGYLTNTIRIIASIPFASYEKFNLIHALIGISLNLSVLIILYVVFNHFYRFKSLKDVI